jgi:hypothetical protein
MRRALSPRIRLGRALGATLVTTAVVTLLSRLLHDHAATAVGVAFLGATWLLVLRGEDSAVAEHGLSLGGLLEPAPLSAARLARDAGAALLIAAALAAIVFPPFWLGFRVWEHVNVPFRFVAPTSLLDDLAGQVVVIALPEEAFFRGFLQSELDVAWPQRVRILGADVGPGLVVSAAVFAVGHMLTVWHPARLAVFFPALVFGWLRARTRGIGAGVAFHASCNLFAEALRHGYGLG